MTEDNYDIKDLSVEGIKLPRVLVLMSTYNGERYLRDQIESILCQKNVDVSLLIRDDGSSDGTQNILKEYTAESKCKIVFGENIGACNSFLWLVKNCGESDYYSFSDQDDIWLEDKLSVAVRKLKEYSSELYHGLAGRVNKNLEPIRNKKYSPKNSFGASLVSSATGCTMVWTRRLMKIYKSYIPKNVSMHDAWLYRVTFAMHAKVFYDTKSHILYRQHESNVSGGEMSFKDKFHKIIKNRGLKYHVAEELRNGFFHIMPLNNKYILSEFLNYKKSFLGKIKIIFSTKFNINSKKTNFQNKLLFIINMI